MTKFIAQKYPKGCWYSRPKKHLCELAVDLVDELTGSCCQAAAVGLLPPPVGAPGRHRGWAGSSNTLHHGRLKEFYRPEN